MKKNIVAYRNVEKKFEVRICHNGEDLYLNFSPQNEECIDLDVDATIEVAVYNKPVDSLEGASDCIVCLDKDIEFEYLKAAVEIWNNNPYLTECDEWHFVSIPDDLLLRMMKGSRLAIIDEFGEPIVNEEFESGSDFYWEDYDEENAEKLVSIVNEYLSYAKRVNPDKYKNLDMDTCEILEIVQSEEPDNMMFFIDCVNKTDFIAIAWIGTIEHCDEVCDIFYDKKNNRFYTMDFNFNPFDISFAEVEIGEFELKLG